MRIYSDRLDPAALRLALAVTAGLGFERYEPISRPRLRSRGWNILLHRAGSSRRFNTGRYGAGEEGAASYSDWGWYLSALYQRDPDMLVAGQYSGRDDFHRRTQGAFRLPRPEDGTDVQRHVPWRHEHEAGQEWTGPDMRRHLTGVHGATVLATASMDDMLSIHFGRHREGAR
jgi:hypothetical protein